MDTSTLFLPTGASPAKLPSLISRVFAGEPATPKEISPAGTDLPSRVTVPLTVVVGGPPWGFDGPQPQSQASGSARQIAKHERGIGEVPAEGATGRASGP